MRVIVAETNKSSLYVVMHWSLRQASEQPPALPIFPQTVLRSVIERYGVA